MDEELRLNFLHSGNKAPVGAGNIFLRHRQACQKLRENTTSPHGFCVAYIEVLNRREGEEYFIVKKLIGCA